MVIPTSDKETLLQRLITEASDVDLICYLVRTEGSAVVQDLLECIADGRLLSIRDIVHNLDVVRKKKAEAHGHPMFPALHRLLHASDTSQPTHQPAAPSGLSATGVVTDVRLH